MSTRDLIDAIEAGDSTKINTEFDSIMVQKVSEKLDAMRDDLSQNMFRPQEVVADEPAPTDTPAAE